MKKRKKMNFYFNTEALKSISINFFSFLSYLRICSNQKTHSTIKGIKNRETYNGMMSLSLLN